MIWIAGAGSLLLLIFVIAGLVDLFRHRSTMKTWQTAVWAFALILIPVAGLILYLFWRLARSETMQDARSYQTERFGDTGPTPPVGL